ncbi:GAP family protein [Mycolicibacterium stellerae]|uniref:GAP family protein n=1 Tax=Mycolicibacterium stellerae TaxID=2358193 RepID=UPI000F0BC4A9|nr:GAP family protein [Mycolicibacterium stellerae]
MWGTVLVFALVAATDPIRIGIAVLLISRPRPVINLFAFWLGGMVTGLAAALVVLLFLRDAAPVLAETVTATIGSPAARHIQIAAGAAAIVIAVVIASRATAPRRMPVAPVAEGTATAPPIPNAIARACARASVALQDRSPGIPFVMGLGSATPPVECVLVLAAIMASGAAIGAQIAAAVLFTILAFAIVEIPLVSFLVNPGGTLAVMLRIHGWSRVHRRSILAVMVAVVGVFLMTTGI